jgi:hypothetical protein
MIACYGWIVFGGLMSGVWAAIGFEVGRRH